LNKKIVGDCGRNVRAETMPGIVAADGIALAGAACDDFRPFPVSSPPFASGLPPAA
jgi:hypothetical protein